MRGCSAAGLVAAVLMGLADFQAVVSVDVAGGSCEVINDSNPELAEDCEQSGFERHGPALLLLGPLRLRWRGAPEWAARVRPPRRWRWPERWCSAIAPADRPAGHRRHRRDRAGLRGGNGAGGDRLHARAGGGSAGAGSGRRGLVVARARLGRRRRRDPARSPICHCRLSGPPARLSRQWFLVGPEVRLLEGRRRAFACARPRSAPSSGPRAPRRRASESRRGGPREPDGHARRSDRREGARHALAAARRTGHGNAGGSELLKARATARRNRTRRAARRTGYAAETANRWEQRRREASDARTQGADECSALRATEDAAVRRLSRRCYQR